MSGCGEDLVLATDAAHDAPHDAVEASADGAAACEPACRAGFVCVRGACVSACNPPCASDEVCTADSQCMPRSTDRDAGGDLGVDAPRDVVSDSTMDAGMDSAADVPPAIDAPPMDVPAVDVPTPTDVTGRTCLPGACNVTDLAIGANQSCVRTNTAQVYCWGNNNPLPVAVAGLDDAAQIAAGEYHVCVIRNSMPGRVFCWGPNGNGQLGDGTTTARSTPVRVVDLTDAVQLAAGSYHTCALRTGGAISCWGSAALGALGDGSRMDNQVRPVVAVGITNAVRVVAGPLATCAILATGELSCWGDGSRFVPTTVPGLTGVIDVSMGDHFTCALRASGTVVCWGNNEFNQLGLGGADSDSHLTPGANVAAISDAVSLAAGPRTTCARRSGGGVRCWGQCSGGECGNGARTNPMGVVDVSSLSDAVLLGSGPLSSHFCALRSVGTVVCWGDNSNAAVGVPTTMSVVTTPSVVSGLP